MTMKKLFKFLSMALVVVMGAMSVACNEKPEPTPPTPGDPETPQTTVSVEAGEAGEEWISFYITSTNAKRIFYVAITEDVIDEIEVNEEFMLASPNMTTEVNTTCEIVFDGRVASTTYYIYAAAVNGKTVVISEPVEMTTLDHIYTTTALPSADNCNIALTALSAMDRYAFALSDESANLYFTFNLYTEKGCNGAIPTGDYTVGSITPGCIELGSLTLEANGLPYVISDGTLSVELYNDGASIRLDGTFRLVSGDSVTFEYDGGVVISGIGSGEVENDGVVKFTNTSLYETSERGWYEIQFQPATGFSMLDVQFYSDPSKDYLTAGFYPVFASGSEAAAMGMGNSWVSTASFYQDDMMFPYIVMPGMDSYIQVNSDLSSGQDYYDITFSLKIQSQVDSSITTLNGTYKGALGFTPSEEVPTMQMVSMYVDITSEGTTHTLNFHGGYTTMVVTIEGALPEIGGDFVWYDITSGRFSDAYARVYDHPVSDGRIAIKRFPDAADASDEGKVKAYYSFQIDAKLEDLTIEDQESGVSFTADFDLVGEWKSFQTKYVSEW